MLKFDIVSPTARLYRVARWPGNPFAPPPWLIARTDGTFGNRFDDPGTDERSPLEERFRVISCATQREAAIGESIARFRPSVAVLSRLSRIPDLETVDTVEFGSEVQVHHAGGTLPSDWCTRRQIGSTRLDSALQFVDISSASSLTTLRTSLAPLADRLNISDIDLSAVSGQQRAFTQACSRFIYQQQDESGAPRFAGIRYISRFHQAWECWAVFADRFWHEPDVPELLDSGDSSLQRAAALLGISIAPSAVLLSFVDRSGNGDGNVVNLPLNVPVILAKIGQKSANQGQSGLSCRERIRAFQ